VKSKTLLFVAFLLGLGSSLFVPTPFGRVAMFDAATFVLAPLCFLYIRKSFSQAEQKILWASFLWFLGACYSNWWREEDFYIALKGDAIVFNVICMLIVTITLLKQSHHAFLWFCVGSAISGVVSLYVFQNGATLEFAESAGYAGQGGVQAFLQEKQVYPIYAGAILMAMLFPLRSMGFIPWLVVFAGCILSAFWLLFWGGSRSGFGTMFITALIVAGYAYFRPLVQAVTRNLLLSLVVMSLLCATAFQTYKHLALSGVLGEAEYQKYIGEIGESESGALGSRDDLIRAWPFLKSHPIVGAGSSAIDRWGVIQDDFKIPGHSAVVGAWTQNGIAGLFFWLYALYLMIDFMRKRMILFGDWFPFLASQLIAVVWHILFSPFGGFRGIICMGVALCVFSCSPKVMEQVTSDLMRKKRL
jgi:hypothetical protein